MWTWSSNCCIFTIYSLVSSTDKGKNIFHPFHEMSPWVKVLELVLRMLTNVGINIRANDAPPSSLMDSTTSPKVKSAEGEGVGVCAPWFVALRG